VSVLSRRAAHDLRTPLNAIIGFTGTLLMRLPGPLNDEQEHQLRLVRESAEELLSRINALSDPDAEAAP
jgi:signal transduction histidine kinase